jgi:hypothetical protein
MNNEVQITIPPNWGNGWRGEVQSELLLAYRQFTYSGDSPKVKVLYGDDARPLLHAVFSEVDPTIPTRVWLSDEELELFSVSACFLETYEQCRLSHSRLKRIERTLASVGHATLDDVFIAQKHSMAYIIHTSDFSKPVEMVYIGQEK